jgi:hypothetical protein
MYRIAYQLKAFSPATRNREALSLSFLPSLPALHDSSSLSFLARFARQIVVPAETEGRRLTRDFASRRLLVAANFENYRLLVNHPRVARFAGANAKSLREAKRLGRLQRVQRVDRKEGGRGGASLEARTVARTRAGIMQASGPGLSVHPYLQRPISRVFPSERKKGDRPRRSERDPKGVVGEGGGRREKSTGIIARREAPGATHVVDTTPSAVKRLSARRADNGGRGPIRGRIRTWSPIRSAESS